MKIFEYISFFIIVSIHTLEDTNEFNLILNDDLTTINGKTVGSKEINGVKFKDKILTITNKGVYILSGVLNGQIKINTNDNEQIILVLSGVTIINPSSNAILISKAYEFDTSFFNFNTTKSLDVTKAGIIFVIRDGSENTINGGKSSYADGAIHSAVSILITGETKNNGILNIYGTSEGIETEKHFFMNGGILNISSEEDGINANTPKNCIIMISGGKLLINSGLGKEGDGIDSDGYILINGGEIISAGKPDRNLGLHADNGIFIDGGKVFSVGSNLNTDLISSSKPIMKLIFNDNVPASSNVTIKNINGKEIISYCADNADFISETDRRTFISAVVSHPLFKINGIYHLYMDGIQLGYTGNNNDKEDQSENSLFEEIKTDFILETTINNFSGVQKAF